MDNYQAIYDAIRSKLTNCNIEEVVKNAIDTINLSFYAQCCTSAIQYAAQQYERPCLLFRPSICIDGNMWSVLYGDNIQDGICGFGETPDKAMLDFDNNYYNQKINYKTGGK